MILLAHPTPLYIVYHAKGPAATLTPMPRCQRYTPRLQLLRQMMYLLCIGLDTVCISDLTVALISVYTVNIQSLSCDLRVLMGCCAG